MTLYMRMIEPNVVDNIDVTSLIAECLRTDPGLPLAGFGVFLPGVGAQTDATGLFTSHRADPSWT